MSIPAPTDTTTMDGDHVRRGLIYAHNRANANTAQVHQANAALQALVELLIEKGFLDRSKFEALQRTTADELRKAYIERGMAVAVQDFGVSKYCFPHVAHVDCENRIHLCRGACCRLPLALSQEDVQEGVVSWEFGQPYMIAHGPDGYCVHMDRETCCCRMYDQRPIPCRGYDCRQDERIWLDFENQVINPQIHEPDWPACLQAETRREEG